jgi:hypothetical protein
MPRLPAPIRSAMLISLFTLLATQAAFYTIQRLQPRRSFSLPFPAPTPFPSRYELPESLSRLPRLREKELPAQPDEPSQLRDGGMEPFLGVWAPPAGKSYTLDYVSKSSGAPLWRASFTTDAHRRRTNSWDKAKAGKAKRHLFGFGCSNTWGYGLNDDETFLAQISRHHPDLTTYNAAFEGYGPTENLLRAKYGGSLEEVAPARGIGAYFYFRDHYRRFVNSSRSLQWRAFTELEEKAPGRFEPVAAAADRHPFWIFFSKIWVHEPIAAAFGWDLPLQTASELDRMLRVISEIRELYRSHTSPHNPFVVVLLPLGHPIDNQLRERLDQARMPFLDYSAVKLNLRLEGPARLPGNSHRAPEFHEKLAAALARDLKLDL